MKLIPLAFLLVAPLTAQSRLDPVTQTTTAPVPQSPPGVTTFAGGVGGDLYGSEVNDDRLYVVDVLTAGYVSNVGIATPVAAGLSTDPLSNLIWGTDTSTRDLFTIDPATGATTIIGFTGITLPHCMAISPDTGQVYAASWELPSTLYELDRATGAATVVGSTGVDYLAGLDFDPTTGVLYGTTFFNSSEVLVTIDPATAAATVVGTTRTLNGLAFDAAGNLFGIYNGVSAGNPSTLYELDKFTGTETLVGDTPLNGNILGLAAAGSGGSVGASYCTPGVSNSTGLPAVISASGSDVAAQNNLALGCVQLPPNQFGYFLNSMGQGFVPNPGGSQGNLCLGLPNGRYSAQLGNSGAGGLLTIQLDLPNTPQAAGSVAISAGETWNFQCWYRDQNPGPTSNFSNGLTVVFQ